MLFYAVNLHNQPYSKGILSLIMETRLLRGFKVRAYSNNIYKETAHILKGSI